jgi:hypothetical protein
VNCFYCAVELGEHGVLDHMTPTSRGGLNVPENLVDCCFSCNSRKSNRTVEEYREYLQQKRGAAVIFPGEAVRPGPYGVPLSVRPLERLLPELTFTLRCRLSDEEKENLFRSADRAKMKVSGYVRALIRTIDIEALRERIQKEKQLGRKP